jgi:hypothetical protein
MFRRCCPLGRPTTPVSPGYPPTGRRGAGTAGAIPCSGPRATGPAAARYGDGAGVAPDPPVQARPHSRTPNQPERNETLASAPSNVVKPWFHYVAPTELNRFSAMVMLCCRAWQAPAELTRIQGATGLRCCSRRGSGLDELVVNAFRQAGGQRQPGRPQAGPARRRGLVREVPGLAVRGRSRGREGFCETRGGWGER